MKKSFIASVYCNGRMYDGPVGVMYDGPPPKAINIKGCRSMDSLRHKIHSRLKLTANQVVSTIVYRFPQHQTEAQYMAYELADDEDLQCAIASYEEHPTMTTMELYVEVSVITLDVGGNNPDQRRPVVGPSTNSAAHITTKGSVVREYSPIQEGDDFQLYDEGNQLYISNDYNPVLDSSVAAVSPQMMAYNRIGSTSTQHRREEESDDPPIMDAHPEITGFEDDEASFDGDDESDTDDQQLPPPIDAGVMAGHGSAANPPNSQSIEPPAPVYSYINWDAMGAYSEFPNVIKPTEESVTDELYTGQEFDGKEALIIALKHYHVKRHHNYVVQDSNTQKLVIKCQNYGDDCSMRLRAINVKNSGTWRITRFTGAHTCVNASLTQDHKALDSDFVCSAILEMVKVKQDVPVSLIQERIESMFGYKISYRKGFMAKQKAIVKVYGDWDKSYEVLPKWLDIAAYNDQLVYKLETEEFITVDQRVDSNKQVFKRLFWAFKPCIAAFPFCKQFIQVDGTFLYGKYKGVLLIAATQDGNRSPVPLAFAIVEKENFDSWSWFLALLRIYVISTQGICLISDRHRAIKEAVDSEGLGWQPPSAYHRYCIRHIASNVRKKCRDENVKKAVMKIGTFCCKMLYIIGICWLF